MYCEYCGKVVDEGAKFCIFCGKSVDTITVSDESVGVICCDNCGNIIEEGDLFCDQCGTKLNDTSSEIKANNPSTENNIKSITKQNGKTISKRCFVDYDDFIVTHEGSSFKIFDTDENIIGFTRKSQKYSGVSAGTVAATLLIGSRGSKKFKKFGFDFFSYDGTKVASIYRDGGVFSYFMVENAEGKIIATMKMRQGKIYDENGNFICKMKPLGLTKCILVDDKNTQLLALTCEVRSLLSKTTNYRFSLSSELKNERRLVICLVSIAYSYISGVS